MRVSHEEKARSRERILDAASSILRRDGLAHAGVSDVMKAAQMTHGGFYRHFTNREDLLSQALHRSFREVQAMAQSNNETGAGGLRFVQKYLSVEHRDELAHGCPAAALGSELARASPELKQAFSKGLEELITALQADDASSTRGATIATLSIMVGALVLSRATTGPLSDELLGTARTQLLALGAPANPS